MSGPILKDKTFFFGLFQRDTTADRRHPSDHSVRLPTPAGYAALQNVPLARGPVARPAVRRCWARSAFLNDVYGKNPVFTSLQNTLVNGVPIETGLTADRPAHGPTPPTTSSVGSTTSSARTTA